MKGNNRNKIDAQIISDKKVLAKRGIVCLFLLFHLNVFAQTILIDPNAEGGFEYGNSIADNGWTAVSDSPNYWMVGTATKLSGTNGIYVTNNGSSYQYSKNKKSSSHFYRDITIPKNEGLIKLSFYLKGISEQGWDRLLIYTASTSVTPVAGIPDQWTDNFPEATLVYTQTTEISDYSRITLTLSSSLAGTTFRLIFTWQNDDNTTYDGKPASVDNIKLTSQYGYKFTTDNTFTLPNCVPQVTIECWGAGGGSGQHGGGGGGGYAKHIINNPETGPYSIIVGKGGAGGKYGFFGNSDGEDGKASTVSYAGTIVAKGDYGRGSNSTTGGGKGGGVNIGNTSTYNGGNGGDAKNFWSYYGGGGGAAGPDGNGKNGENATPSKPEGNGGAGNNGLGGFGGTGNNSRNNNNGNNGSDDANGGGGGGGGQTNYKKNGGDGGFPGGGGGGGQNYCGKGADGQIIFSWIPTKTEAICKDTSVYLDASGNAIVTPEMIDNGSTGNCNIDTMWVEPNTLSCMGDPGYHSDILHSDNNNFSVKIYITNIHVEKISSWGNVNFNFNIVFDYNFEFSGNIPPEQASNFTIKFSCYPKDIYSYDGIAKATRGTATFFAGTMKNVSQDYYDNFTFDSLKCTNTTITLINAYNKNGEKLNATNVELQTSYDQQVSLIVQDQTGNKDTCASFVTVLDTIPPQITCPPDIIDTVYTGQDSVSNINLGIPTAYDNCSIIDTSNNAPSWFPADDTTIVSWKVTDASGNTDTCEQEIIIVQEKTFDVTISDSTTSCNRADEVPGYNGNDTTTTISFTVDTLGISWDHDWEFTFTLSSTTGATLSNVSTSAGIILGTNPYVVTNITAGARVVIAIDVTGDAFTGQNIIMKIIAAKELTMNIPAVGKANWHSVSIVNPIPRTSNITAN